MCSLHELCCSGALTAWRPAGVLQELREDGALTGWRSESYPVLTSFHSEPLALVERAAAVHLGIKAYGVHVNGYVRGPSGIELWVAHALEGQAHLARATRPHCRGRAGASSALVFGHCCCLPS